MNTPKQESAFEAMRKERTAMEVEHLTEKVRRKEQQKNDKEIARLVVSAAERYFDYMDEIDPGAQEPRSIMGLVNWLQGYR